ncbi:zinc phosphodiesterase ELAC protein 2-like [Argonauta hians]
MNILKSPLWTLIKPSSLLSSPLTLSTYYSRSRANKVKRLLQEMPKTQTSKEKLRHVRYREQIGGKLPIPGKIELEVIGSGSRGTPRSVILSTDHVRYLFNCGEGTQRIASEHKFKMSRLENVFVTHNSWDNIGGLLGLALTLEAINVPKIMVHGPPRVEQSIRMAKTFAESSSICIEKREAEMGVYEDGAFKIEYVRLLPSESHRVRAPPTHGGRESLSEDGDPAPAKKMRYSCEELDVSMAYICTPHPARRRLNYEKCVELGIPVGPLLGILKSEKPVTLDSGTTIHPDQVLSDVEKPYPLLVLECPGVEYLDSVLSNDTLASLQSSTVDPVDVVVHMSSVDILSHPRYQQWMNRFPPSTSHLIVNESTSSFANYGSYKIQAMLNLLSPTIFPLLYHQRPEQLKTPSILSDPPHNNQGHLGETSVNSATSHNSKDQLKEPSENSASTQKPSDSLKEVNSVPPHSPTDASQDSALPHNSTDPLKGPSSNTVLPHKPNVQLALTNLKFVLRPRKGFNFDQCLELSNSEFVREAWKMEGFEKQLKEFHVKSKEHSVNVAENVSKQSPEILFLGTGSSVPSKRRNVSGILVQIQPDNYMLLDCGEGTAGQLYRHYGPQTSAHILRNLRAIFISHMHADHHMGLFGVLRERERCLRDHHEQQHQAASPVLLLSPIQIRRWLHFYMSNVEDLQHALRLVPLHTLLPHKSDLNSDTMTELLTRLQLSKLVPVEVEHCKNSFGVVLSHPSGWSLVYSGDTMPCDRLIVRTRQNCDLLIHEATMEDDLEEEAKIKTHSTTSQAIDVGLKMSAQFILLNHFSQRYSKIPIISDRFSDKVGISFDNMRVSLSDLALLPHLNVPLKTLFAEDYAEMEEKILKRVLRRNMEEEETGRNTDTSPAVASLQ